MWSGVGLPAAISPEGTAENAPGRQSWVNWTTRECYWQSSNANPILSGTTDCIQSTHYLYTKRDCSLIWTALAESPLSTLDSAPKPWGYNPPHHAVSSRHEA